jgi:hypothetical protein
MEINRLHQIQSALESGNQDALRSLTAEEHFEISLKQKEYVDAWAVPCSVGRAVNNWILDLEYPRPNDYEIENTESA